MEIVAELKEAFQKFKAENEAATKSIEAMVKEQEKGTKESLDSAVKQAEKIAQDVMDQSKRLVDLEQKLVAGIHKGTEAPKSLGQLVVESDLYKKFAEGQAGKCRITLDKSFDVQANTITGQTGSPATNSDILVAPDRMAGIIPGAFRRLRVKDLLPSGTTESNMIKATRELAFTNNAQETGEGKEKKESILTFELADFPVRTIAHFLKVSTQVKDDAPALMSYINTRLAYGVNLREEQQIVAGNATGENLKGMTHSDNRTAFTPSTGDNALDSLNRAKYLIDNSDYQATGILMNPLDWGEIERTKVGSSDERYVVGDPRSALGPFLWGLPVVVTPSMTQGKLLVAAFDIAFMYWLRKETVVEIFEQDETNVQYNLLTVRAEKRAALAGMRPASVLYGDLKLS